MTAYALIGEGENVRGGKCPPFTQCIYVCFHVLEVFDWVS